MQGQLMAINNTPDSTMLGLIDIVFLPILNAPSPTQYQPSFDLANLLLGVLTVLGTIITVLGLLVSIYFFQRTMSMSTAKIETKPEQSIDPSILVLDIYRCPVDKKLWEKYRNQAKLQLDQARTTNNGVRVMLVLSVFFAFTLNYLYYSSSFPAGQLPPFLIVARIAFSLFALLFIALVPLTTKAYNWSKMRFRKIDTSPEKASWWLMDHAEMAVCAEYNYLFLKAQWVLKQMSAEAITVKSDSVEGMMVNRSSFRMMKSTIKPDPDEKNTFLISVNLLTAPRQSQLIKGSYINRFLDLMVSGGFEGKQQAE
jgi:hypothetical protein